MHLVARLGAGAGRQGGHDQNSGEDEADGALLSFLSPPQASRDRQKVVRSGGEEVHRWSILDRSTPVLTVSPPVSVLRRTLPPRARSRESAGFPKLERALVGTTRAVYWTPAANLEPDSCGYMPTWCRPALLCPSGGDPTPPEATQGLLWRWIKR